MIVARAQISFTLTKLDEYLRSSDIKADCRLVQVSLLAIHQLKSKPFEVFLSLFTRK